MSTDSASSTGGANLVSDVSQQRVASINSANVTVPETKPGEGPASAPKLHEVSRRSPFGALLSRTLPSYTGSYDVGVCDIEVPVERQTFGNFAHKSMPNKPAGLTLDTVLFSMFYPCEKPNSPKPVVWFPNMRQTIDGFLRMAQRTPNFWYRAVSYPLAAAAISGTTFPATKNAPILSPPGGRKWQLMIFSHGVGCSRLMYSAFCGEMASRGYIVCAIEHRDGTSPSSKITSADGTTQVLDWLQWSDLQWPDELIQPTDDTRLRHEQLKLRAAEISACVAIMTRVATGEKPASSLTAPDFDWSRWTVLDTSRPVMAGHSLGGSAALVVSASHGAVDEEGSIKWRAVLVMDPATQRIAPWTSELPHPLLVLCSEEFAVGDEYAIFAEQVAGTVSAGRPSPHTIQPQKAKGPFGDPNQPGLEDDGAPLVFSIPGATHPSFSDVFLILPESVNRMTGLRVAASTVVSLTINACADFLNGKAEAIEKRSVVYRPKKVREEIPVIDASVAEGEPEKVADVPRPYKPVGKAGDLVWHQFERDEQGQ